MSAIDRYLSNNAEYVAGFSKGGLPMPPAREIAIVACMDARLETGALLGLAEGEAHVIRNAGGVVTDDVIRSLTISQRLLGTREIMLIHHTDCDAGRVRWRRCDDPDLRPDRRHRRGGSGSPNCASAPGHARLRTRRWRVTCSSDCATSPTWICSTGSIFTVPLRRWRPAASTDERTVATVRDYWPVCLHGTAWWTSQNCAGCTTNNLSGCMAEYWGWPRPVGRVMVSWARRRLTARATGLVAADKVLAVSEAVRLGGSNHTCPAPTCRSFRTSSIRMAFWRARHRHLGPVIRRTCRRWSRARRAVILPSAWDEPLSRLVLETMGLGTPVIAWASGGNPEIIDSGETGWLVGNADDLSGALAELESPDHRARIGAAGRVYLARNYSPDAVYPRVASVYAEAIEKAGRRTS